MKLTDILTEAVYRSSPLLTKLNSLKPELVAAAQSIYDQWDESEDYAGGGICHLIADEFSTVLWDHGIPSVGQSLDIGEVHVWTIAYSDKLDEDGDRDSYIIDINPSTYETGGGYSWKKIPDITFDENDIYFDTADADTVEHLISDY